MRAMKFRGWHVSTKTMDYDPLAIPGGNSTDHLNRYFDEEAQRWQVLMAWTGLKDKNGVEIYEGDILEGGGTWKVVFNHGEFKCVATRMGVGTEIANMATFKRVIGNIYENGELLA